MAFVWEPAGRKCAGGPTPGAVALRRVVAENFELTATGIYACRPVRGGTTPSVHGEGRAIDFHVAELGGAEGQRIADWLVRHWEWLGVQQVIWNHREWGGRGGPSWGPYFGASNHRDHVHAELTRSAARTLTEARVRAVIEEGDMFEREDRDRLEMVYAHVTGDRGKRPTADDPALLNSEIAELRRQVSALNSRMGEVLRALGVETSRSG